MLLSQDSPKRIVAAFAEQIPPGPVLDLGCNTGRNTLFLAPKHYIDAVDNNQEALNFLQHPNINVIHQNIMEFVFEQNYSGIVCTDVLHFLSLDNIRMLIKRIQSHTLPGGINIITVFTKSGELKGMQHFFDRNELKNNYEDWDILHYEEKWVDCHTKKTDGKHLRHESAILVARKSI
jgi:tellurite methyltransferase